MFRELFSIFCSHSVLVFQLVNGDVSLRYRHQGFAEKTKTSFVSTVLKGDKRNDCWLDSIAGVLSEVRRRNNYIFVFIYSRY